MKIGDKVRIAAIPPNLPEGDMMTRSLFEKCLGNIFAVSEFDENGFLRLDVGHIVNEPAYCHTIWIESEFVESIVSDGCA